MIPAKPALIRCGGKSLIHYVLVISGYVLVIGGNVLVISGNVLVIDIRPSRTTPPQPWTGRSKIYRVRFGLALF